MPPRKAPPSTDQALTDVTGSDGIPLYVRLAMSLRTRIFQGEWRIGDRLPPFDALARHYGVAMNTVRKAIQVIASEALVSSARGMGTTVIAAAPPMPHPTLRAAISDPLALSEDIEIRILERQVVAALPAELQEGYDMARQYQRIAKMHVLRGTPFAVLDIYVDREVFKRFPPGAERTQKLSRLQRDFGGEKVVASREELTVRHADSQLADTLRIATALPIVRLRRWRIAESGHVGYACIANYRSDLFVWDVTRPEAQADHFHQHIIPTVRQPPR